MLLLIWAFRADRAIFQNLQLTALLNEICNLIRWQSTWFVCTQQSGYVLKLCRQRFVVLLIQIAVGVLLVVFTLDTLTCGVHSCPNVFGC